MTPIERRFLRTLIVGVTVTMIVVAFLRWTAGTEVPVGDPDLVPVGIAATLPPTTSSTVPPVSSTVPATSSIPPSTSTTLLEGEWLCPEAVADALAVGWAETELVRLDRTVHRESRCIPGVTNLKGRDRSYGLLQVNVKGGLWADRATLCGLARPDDLLDPRTNLECALRLFERSGWAPWGGGA